ncbi:hypothetical protein JAAARDRAFT_34655 [Jaapia argillacea MUCL 33604]|uniref:DUF1770-domain-containing protein n=1 Tax=Jaapia argillacea MUCL 33604 TaxID=933084 RepID=A0A067PVN4_9AGAM|nr:hypothetical protein JAAARDRAFT_34655 [Jaapia argillacea MUCL 33604]
MTSQPPNPYHQFHTSYPTQYPPAPSQGPDPQDLHRYQHDDDDDLPSSKHKALPRLPVIPDMRFEQSYLKKIEKFVHVEEREAGNGKKKEGHGESRIRDVEVRVEWNKVIWITTRDQVISPLLQGAIWGVASHFLRPMAGLLTSNIRNWWVRHDPSKLPAGKEGKGAGWLRGWLRASMGAVGGSITAK